MEREVAIQTLTKWVETVGKEVYVPEFLLSLGEVVLTAYELERSIFITLRGMENDMKTWCMWAYHTVGSYWKHISILSPDIAEELRHILKVAEEYDRETHGFNPQQYRMSENPIRGIIDNLTHSDL